MTAAEVDLFGDELKQFEDGAIAPPRGRGRPPGSPNRTTLQMARLLQAKGYRDPAEFLAAVMTKDTKELAGALGIDADKALGLQVRAAEGLMPYFHQKLPTAVEVAEGAPRPIFVINDGTVNVQLNQGVMPGAAEPQSVRLPDDRSQTDVTP